MKEIYVVDIIWGIKFSRSHRPVFSPYNGKSTIFRLLTTSNVLKEKRLHIKLKFPVQKLTSSSLSCARHKVSLSMSQEKNSFFGFLKNYNFG